MANNLNADLTGKIVVLDSRYYRGDVRNRLFRCETGFGCSPNTRGTAIGGTFLVDGERVRVEGDEVQRFATPEEAALNPEPKS